MEFGIYRTNRQNVKPVFFACHMMCVRRRGGGGAPSQPRIHKNAKCLLGVRVRRQIRTYIAVGELFVVFFWLRFQARTKRLHIAAINTKMYNNNAIEAVDVCATKIYTGGDGIWWQDGFSLFYLLLSIVFVHDNHIWGKHCLRRK